MTQTAHTPTADNMARTPWKIGERPAHEPGRRAFPWQAKDCDGAVVAHFASSHAALAAMPDRLERAAPDMLAALKAEAEADALFDAADEHTHRAEAEGWLNDPTGSLHVTESWDVANKQRERAKALRSAAIAKAEGRANA